MNETLNPLMLLIELSKEFQAIEQKMFNLRQRMLDVQQAIINQGQPTVSSQETEEMLPFATSFYLKEF